MSTAVMAERLAAERQFVAPPAAKGMVVFWYPGGNTTAESAVAVVTEVHGKCLALGLVLPNSRNLAPKDAVPHVSDPMLKRVDISGNSGGWDYTPEWKRFVAMEKTLADLMAPHTGAPVKDRK